MSCQDVMSGCHVRMSDLLCSLTQSVCIDSNPGISWALTSPASNSSPSWGKSPGVSSFLSISPSLFDLQDWQDCSSARVLRLWRNTYWQGYTSFASLRCPVLAYGIFGLFVTPPLEDCLPGLQSSSTRAGTGDTELQLADVM